MSDGGVDHLTGAMQWKLLGCGLVEMNFSEPSNDLYGVQHAMLSNHLQSITINTYQDQRR